MKIILVEKISYYKKKRVSLVMNRVSIFQFIKMKIKETLYDEERVIFIIIFLCQFKHFYQQFTAKKENVSRLN